MSKTGAERTQPIATPQIDRYNKQDFSDFWAISYHFVHIVMLIIIQMRFDLLTTISLLFVWGALLNNFEKGQGLTAPKAPLLHLPGKTSHLCLILFFSFLQATGIQRLETQKFSQMIHLKVSNQFKL